MEVYIAVYQVTKWKNEDEAEFRRKKWETSQRVKYIKNYIRACKPSIFNDLHALLKGRT
jgi:UDP-glucose 6-dehydrogenase